MEAFMRAHHVIAVVAVLVIGLGAKQYFFPPPFAEAAVKDSSMAAAVVIPQFCGVVCPSFPPPI
jgi:ABC-type phosphate transport system auxiliary subunit